MFLFELFIRWTSIYIFFKVLWEMHFGTSRVSMLHFKELSLLIQLARIRKFKFKLFVIKENESIKLKPKLCNMTFNFQVKTFFTNFCHEEIEGIEK